MVAVGTKRSVVISSIAPLRGPWAAGAKRARTLACSPGCRLRLVGPPGSENSGSLPGKSPSTFTAQTPVPALLMTAEASASPPGCTAPKSRLAGLNWTVQPPASTASAVMAMVASGVSESLLCTRKKVLMVPAAVGAKLRSMSRASWGCKVAGKVLGDSVAVSSGVFGSSAALERSRAALPTFVQRAVRCAVWPTPAIPKSTVGVHWISGPPPRPESPTAFVEKAGSG